MRHQRATFPSPQGQGLIGNVNSCKPVVLNTQTLTQQKAAGSQGRCMTFVFSVEFTFLLLTSSNNAVAWKLRNPVTKTTPLKEEHLQLGVNVKN